VQPSSLIFLVIVGIWAAYFVQYWVRRREHVATARSVDAFSETMRVLQRRAPLPEANLTAPSPDSYAVGPARAVRPQILVKRAETAEPAGVDLSPASGRSLPMSADTLTPAGRTAEDDSASAAFAAPGGPSLLHHRPMQPSRATRGIVLLVGALTTPVFAVLGAFGVLVGWAFLVPLAMAVGGFLWLRHGVQQEIAAKRAVRAARAAGRRPARSTGAGTAAYAAFAGSAPAASAQATGVDAPARAEATAVEAVFDEQSLTAASGISESVEVAETPATVPAAAVVEVDEDDVPLTWDPVPVPRPTYTMKARVERRPVAPAAPAPASSVQESAPAAEYDELTGT
jgi:hypothetical protein